MPKLSMRLLACLFLALLLHAHAAAESEPLTRYPAVKRIVAIGDLHGDLKATRAALRLAGAIDERDRWVGHDLVVVQTGDQLDRGEQEIAILELLERLAVEAHDAGGAVHVLNGNHELMNASGDFRYVTPRGFRETAKAMSAGGGTPEPDGELARRQAFSPPGRYARLLSRRNMVVMIGENVFVHGGVLPEHLKLGLDRYNSEMRRWLRGDAPAPDFLQASDSPVWTRLYSGDGAADCETLTRTLAALGAKRMIVGHSVQKRGINEACEGHVWRIDTGMSHAYGGPVQVLEIAGDQVRVLR